MSNIKENGNESMQDPNPLDSVQPIAQQEVRVEDSYDTPPDHILIDQNTVNKVDKLIYVDVNKPMLEDKNELVVQNEPVAKARELLSENGDNPPRIETKDSSFSVESMSPAKPSLICDSSTYGNNALLTETKEGSVYTELESGREENFEASCPFENEKHPPQTEAKEISVNVESKSSLEDRQTVSFPSASLNGHTGRQKHGIESFMDGKLKSNKTPEDKIIHKLECEPPKGGKHEINEYADANTSLKPAAEPTADGQLEMKEVSDVDHSLKSDTEPQTDHSPEENESTIITSAVKLAEYREHENLGLADSKPEALVVGRDTIANNLLGTTKAIEDSEAEPYEASENKLDVEVAANTTENRDTNEPSAGSEAEPFEREKAQNKYDHSVGTVSEEQSEPARPHVGLSDVNLALENKNCLKNEKINTELHVQNGNGNASDLFLLDDNYEGTESGMEEEQSAFMKELECFFRERNMEFKPPKFYGEGLNCLKLWRAVMRLGGYDKVTSCKLWRQVGESFKPPKTCTTVSWTFRGFYEKALLDYERSKVSGGEFILSTVSNPEPMIVDSQTPGSGRARRDAAARAMRGWHSQRVFGSGEVSDPIIKDKGSLSWQKREKEAKSLDGTGSLKRKKPYLENAVKSARTKRSNQLDVEVTDIGPSAEWVKINVQKLKDCFEIYALVPGLLREEVRVQLDPAGRLVISGEPQHPDNPWGVTPFKKVVSLPSRIDPQDTTAVVTLHGQLYVRTPFEQPSV